MSQEFRLAPPPTNLLSPLVELRNYYVQLVQEYEIKLELARAQLSHVEALLCGWDEVAAPSPSSLPGALVEEPASHAPAMTDSLPSPSEFARLGSITAAPLLPVGVAHSSNGHVEGEEKKALGFGQKAEGIYPDANSPSHLATDREQGSQSPIGQSSVAPVQDSSQSPSDSLPAPLNPAPLPLLEHSIRPLSLTQFTDSLDSSTRSLLSFCAQSGELELANLSEGGYRLLLVCPNDAVWSRLKLKLPGLAHKLNHFVGSTASVFVSTLSNPIDNQTLELTTPTALLNNGLVVDKMLEYNGATYTQLKHPQHHWLVVVPSSLPRASLLDVIPNQEPPQPTASSPEKQQEAPNTNLNGSSIRPNSNHEAQLIEMLPPYQGMNRIEALSLLFAEHSGTVLHLDFIVRSLYGELEPELFKVIKNRVGSSLLMGVEQKLWARVTDSPGCYTQENKLVEPASPPPVKRSGEGRLSHRNRKSSYFQLSSLMLPPYRGQSLKVALVSLLEANPGKIYYIDDFIALLFGEVEASQTGRVRDTVTKMLSEGKLSGRFESVPGKKGGYTLSCSLLSAQSQTRLP